MQEWLDNNDILMYSTHNEGKPVISEKSTKILRAKILFWLQILSSLFE